MKLVWPAYLAFVALCCAIPARGAYAQAQLTTQDFVIAPIGRDAAGNFVLDQRTLDVFETMMRGDENDEEIPTKWLEPRTTENPLTTCSPLIADPVIGSQRVGFVNTTDAVVEFSVVSGGSSMIHTLVGHELMTVELTENAASAATVSTGDHDETVSLEGGVLYRLRGKEQHWIFARD